MNRQASDPKVFDRRWTTRNYDALPVMSKELAAQLERDLSASEETQQQLRQASKRGAALDVDWDEALELYRSAANQDPKRIVRFPGIGHETMSNRDSKSIPRDARDSDNHESAAPK